MPGIGAPKPAIGERQSGIEEPQPGMEELKSGIEEPQHGIGKLSTGGEWFFLAVLGRKTAMGGHQAVLSAES